MIFRAKRLGVIFQMIEDEQVATVRLPCQPDTAILAFGQNLDAGSLELIAPVFGIARHGHREIIGEAAHQPPCHRLELVPEHAEQLVAAIMLQHAMEMIEERLSTPADAKPAEAMCPRPVHDLGQLFPIGDLFEGKPLDRRAGHDQRIEELILHILKAPVEAAQIGRLGMARRVARRGHQDQFDLQRRIAEQAGELDLRLLLFRHQVQQEQPQRPDILTKRLFLRHHIDLLGKQVFEGWQIVWHLDGHAGLVSRMAGMAVGTRLIAQEASQTPANRHI